MRVEARAIVFKEGKLVTTVERRQGEPHSALPGGGVERRETVEQALVREVREETGLVVVPHRLVYVFQVVSRYDLHDVNFVFLARIEGEEDGATYDLIDPRDGAGVAPPILDRIASDHEHGWREHVTWLGNVYRA